MSTIITLEQFKKCMPACKEPSLWAPLVDQRLFADGIVEPQQIASFLAQTGHESVSYNVLQENLNYSADGLLRTFGKYFRDVDVNAYARKPEKIANRVYANRIGNGSESSGDGWRFRGRGIIQVTGRANYEECSQYMFGDKMILLDDPDMLSEKEHALASALWYWDKHKLKNITDQIVLTKKINGGTNGLDDRVARYKTTLSVLKV